MAARLFKVQGDTLTLYRDPEPTEMNGVKEALYALVGEGPGGTLDMSPMQGVSSTTVGLVVAVHLRSAEAGRKFRIRINEKLLQLFELTMLTDTLSLEMVGKDVAEKPPGTKGERGGRRPAGRNKP